MSEILIRFDNQGVSIYSNPPYDPRIPVNNFFSMQDKKNTKIILRNDTWKSFAFDLGLLQDFKKIRLIGKFDISVIEKYLDNKNCYSEYYDYELTGSINWMVTSFNISKLPEYTKNILVELQDSTCIPELISDLQDFSNLNKLKIKIKSPEKYHSYFLNGIQDVKCKTLILCFDCNLKNVFKSQYIKKLVVSDCFYFEVREFLESSVEKIMNDKGELILTNENVYNRRFKKQKAIMPN